MSEYAKIAATRLHRTAVAHVRQSSASQLERNRESTDRQYALVERAVSLGWPRQAVRVIDADLGISGSRGTVRGGFTELTRSNCQDLWIDVGQAAVSTGGVTAC